MSPFPSTRRRVLRALPAAVGIGLAGCASLDSGERTRTTTAPLRTDPDPAFARVRSETSAAALRSSVRTPRRGEGRDDWVPTHWLVATERDREGLRFGDGVGGVPEARALLADTDFERESVFVRQTAVPQALMTAPERVAWRRETDGTDHLSLTYRSVERAGDHPPDAPVDAEALLVRVPAPLSDLGSVSMGS